MVMAPSAITPTQEYTIPTFSRKSNGFVYHNYGADETYFGRASSKELVLRKLKERVAGIDVDTCLPGEEDAFYVADLGEVYRQHLRWKLNLGRVKPFYGESQEMILRYFRTDGFHSCQMQP